MSFSIGTRVEKLIVGVILAVVLLLIGQVDWQEVLLKEGHEDGKGLYGRTASSFQDGHRGC